ncbi:MAG: phosphopantothenoylcysteine decarboxylase / phosphopantothenate---cysteine ligase [Actinomycetota bacterium]|jgi:phosphopantothenoylcysteine decarboxylase/phosphopantothenate--cysteine ligase|nr:phosphopantothenoylcysteine decarboxylase / phosphopantothenate---cysteine ligase [Actinomycetota bacterium]
MAGVLAGRRIVLGVSGGIAAYKAVEVCRRLTDAGAYVQPVLTEDATRFVGALTFSALAAEPARTSLWDGPEPIPHTRLGQGADLVLVAPATARVIGKYAAGISDDLLTATLLATRAPVVVCPAMHTEMWEHPAVQDNLAVLARRGVHVVPPAVGRLAGGDEGAGRLADPEDIVAAVERIFTPPDLSGVSVLVTAGGTREPIDPVRFIGNRSSGKQGHAIADEAAARGARVVLVTTARRSAHSSVEIVEVDTAAQMEDAVLRRSNEADVVIMAAAVADFRPKAAADEKIKKHDGVPELVLEPTTDILAALGKQKRPGQVLVGFAAETSDVRDRAAEKLRTKNVDLIVANDVSAPGAGFEHDTNIVVLLDPNGLEHNVPLTDKREVARLVVDAVVSRLSSRSQSQ